MNRWRIEWHPSLRLERALVRAPTMVSENPIASVPCVAGSSPSRATLPSMASPYSQVDLERCALRAGNVHSADGWDDVLKPVVARYQGKVSRIYFRADAAFAMPEVYEFLEAERIKYAIRLPANQVLQSRIGYL